MTQLTQNGVSTTTKNNSFHFEEFKMRDAGKMATLIQWDYRDANGMLHSGVARSLAIAREKASKYGYTG